MPFKNADGLKSFFSLQNIELENIKKDAEAIPKKSKMLSRVTDPDLVSCIEDSIAFKIHGAYTGIENFLENVAKEFDQYIPDGKNWHAQLLTQMASPVGDRGAILSEGTRLLLNELRSFRHFIRNDYGAVLDGERVVELGAVAINALNLLSLDLSRFEQECFSDENDGDGDGAGGGAAGGPPPRNRGMSGPK